MASMIFAGMSGSALADAGGLGTIEVKAMTDAGYDKDFSVAVTAASAGIGPIIPPSINFVVWAFLSKCSTLAMFQAGMIPGICMGVAMMAWVVFASKKFNIAAPVIEKSNWRDRYHSTLHALPALGGPGILVLGIMTGVFTPTECSVVAAAYCVILSIALKRFSFKMLKKALLNTLSSSGMAMSLCATGLIFNWMIVTSGLMTAMTDFMLGLGSRVLILLVLNGILLFLGCFIGSMQILIMVAPLLMNIATGIGMSYVQIGVMAVLNVTLGLITPPMAPALFVTAKATGGSFDRALKYTVQFLIPLTITLIFVTFFEPLTMWLPRFLGSIR
jgi:tripartite ATP-independent transporter DctM subunit